MIRQAVKDLRIRGRTTDHPVGIQEVPLGDRRHHHRHHHRHFRLHPLLRTLHQGLQ